MIKSSPANYCTFCGEYLYDVSFNKNTCEYGVLEDLTYKLRILHVIVGRKGPYPQIIEMQKFLSQEN